MFLQPLLNNSVQIPNAFQSNGLAYEYLSAQNYMASRLATPSFDRWTGEVSRLCSVGANCWAHTLHLALLQATATGACVSGPLCAGRMRELQLPGQVLPQ